MAQDIVKIVKSMHNILGQIYGDITQSRVKAIENALEIVFGDLFIKVCIK